MTRPGFKAITPGRDGYRVDGLGQGRGDYVSSRQLGSFGSLVDTGGKADSYPTQSPNQSLTYPPRLGNSGGLLNKTNCRLEPRRRVHASTYPFGAGRPMLDTTGLARHAMNYWFNPL
ncbi:MAG: hypothetical protein QF434_00725 [Nitrospinaceae bacterium]|nr:hypothetical protein [Nitrospinaceae bacterium]